MNKKVLLLVKTPPPITGATLMNSRVLKSKRIRKKLNISKVEMSYNNERKDMGNLEISKAMKFAKYIYVTLYKILSKNIHTVYFQISPFGIGLARDAVFAILLKLMRCHIVYHIHGTGIGKKAQRSKLKKVLYKIIFNNTSLILLSEKFKEDIKPVHEGKVFCVPNGIEDNKKARYKESGHEKSVLFLSNMKYSKGIQDYVKIINYIRSEYASINGKIVGNEADYSVGEVEKMLVDTGVSDIVSIMGPVYGSKKFEIMTNADLLVYPTHKDAQPTVIIEALQNYTPVVAYNEGAISEMVISGENGYVVPKGNTHKASEKAIEILENEELLRGMKVSARRQYEDKFTLQKFERRIKSVLEREIKQKT